MSTVLCNDFIVVVGAIQLEVASRAIQPLRLAFHDEVFLQRVVVALEMFTTLEWTSLNREIFTCTAMDAPLLI